MKKWAQVVRGGSSSTASLAFKFLAKVDRQGETATLRRHILDGLFEHALANDDWETGDLGTYTRDVLDKRCDMRYSTPVTLALDCWWLVIMSILDEAERKTGRITEEQYCFVMLKIYRAIQWEGFNLESAHRAVANEWLHDSRISTKLPRERAYDALFEIADQWTDVIEAEVYGVFLRELLDCVAKDGMFRDDDDIRQMLLHEAVVDTTVVPPAGVGVKSKYMQDAEAQAKKRRDSTVKLQAQQRSAAARQEARDRAKYEHAAAERALKEELRLTLGRDPNAADLMVAREAKMEAKLAEELGRPPSEVELAAAREASLQARMAARLGHPPTAAELAAAREQAMGAVLEARLGRPPSDAERAAARDEDLRARLAAKTGRPPSADDLAVAREAQLQEELRGRLGRPPTKAEQAAAQEKDMLARLELSLGRPPDETEVAEVRAMVKARSDAEATRSRVAGGGDAIVISGGTPLLRYPLRRGLPYGPEPQPTSPVEDRRIFEPPPVDLIIIKKEQPTPMPICYIGRREEELQKPYELGGSWRSVEQPAADLSPAVAHWPIEHDEEPGERKEDATEPFAPSDRHLQPDHAALPASMDVVPLDAAPSRKLLALQRLLPSASTPELTLHRMLQKSSSEISLHSGHGIGLSRIHSLYRPHVTGSDPCRYALSKPHAPGSEGIARARVTTKSSDPLHSPIAERPAPPAPPASTSRRTLNEPTARRPRSPLLASVLRCPRAPRVIVTPQGSSGIGAGDPGFDPLPATVEPPTRCSLIRTPLGVTRLKPTTPVSEAAATAAAAAARFAAARDAARTPATAEGGNEFRAGSAALPPRFASYNAVATPSSPVGTASPKSLPRHSPPPSSSPRRTSPPRTFSPPPRTLIYPTRGHPTFIPGSEADGRVAAPKATLRPPSKPDTPKPRDRRGTPIRSSSAVDLLAGQPSPLLTSEVYYSAQLAYTRVHGASPRSRRCTSFDYEHLLGLRPRMLSSTERPGPEQGKSLTLGAVPSASEPVLPESAPTSNQPKIRPLIRTASRPVIRFTGPRPGYPPAPLTTRRRQADGQPRASSAGRRRFEGRLID